MVSLEATDNAGVAGIEYRLNLSGFLRYEGPLLLATGSNIRFRAVDVNGTPRPHSRSPRDSRHRLEPLQSGPATRNGIGPWKTRTDTQPAWHLLYEEDR